MAAGGRLAGAGREMSIRSKSPFIGGVLCAALWAAPGWAPAVQASCYPVAQRAPGPVLAAFAATGGVRAHHVGITFVGHASFEVESPQGVRVVTDYTDYVRPARRPHIVTMNNLHDTHFSYGPEAGIEHILRGWDPAGGVARHNVMLKDVRVRNVPTNLSDLGGRLRNGNSMFVIETAGLCIVHISHLHHVLSPAQLRDLGRVDIAFAPIDGMWTMSHEELFEVLDQIRPLLIVPMHFGSMGGVEAFVARAKTRWPVREHGGASIELSVRDLPRKTEVLFLRGY